MQNNPQIDYLRLATWETDAYVALQRFIADYQPKMEPGRWLQYNGRRTVDGTMFLGTGEQHHKRHHIWQVSGDNAHIWGERVMNLDDIFRFYCTRIDLQITIPEPEKHDARKLYKKVNRKKKSLIESPTNSTVYIGARTSDLFIRIYEKILENRFLRCEFELKGDYAKTAWSHILMSLYTALDIYSSCLSKAKIPEPWRSWFLVDSDSTTALKHEEYQASLVARLAWLDNTETALVKYLYDHDTQQKVIALIDRLYTASQKLT